jgi:hypothetical protein
MLVTNLHLAIEHPNLSDARSEEERMSTIELTNKAAKLMKLCDAAGYKTYEDLLRASVADNICPAICMTEGCDHVADMESDQVEGYCEACGGNTVVSVMVLAGLI